LRRTEPLQPLARGAQAGTDLQRLAEIGNGARFVAEPHLGLAASSGGVVTLMQVCQLWSDWTDHWTDPWTDPWADAAVGCASITAVLSNAAVKQVKTRMSANPRRASFPFVAGLHRRVHAPK
jgi:hypothetical protein